MIFITGSKLTRKLMLILIYLEYLMYVTISLGSVIFTGINCYKSVIYNDLLVEIHTNAIRNKTKTMLSFHNL